MGNTCKSMADSFQCMTKSTTIKKKFFFSNKSLCPPISKPSHHVEELKNKSKSEMYNSSTCQRVTLKPTARCMLLNILFAGHMGNLWPGVGWEAWEQGPTLMQ